MLVAESVAEKQRRRQSWQQNFDRYALAAKTRLYVDIAGGDELRRMLCFGGADRAAAAAAA